MIRINFIHSFPSEPVIKKLTSIIQNSPFKLPMLGIVLQGKLFDNENLLKIYLESIRCNMSDCYKKLV